MSRDDTDGTGACVTKAPNRKGHKAYQVETGITVTHINPAAFLYNLPDFPATFFRSPLVTSTEQFVAALRDNWRRDGIERKHRKRLGKLLLAKALPDAVYSQLWWQLPFLHFLLVIAVVGGGSRNVPLSAVVAVRFGRR
jgi:hypothetical protein